MDRNVLKVKLAVYGARLDGKNDDLVLGPVNDGPEIHYRNNWGIIERHVGELAYASPWEDMSQVDMESEVRKDGPVGWWLKLTLGDRCPS